MALLPAVLGCGLLVGCVAQEHNQITVENRTNADAIIAVTHDFGTTTYWVPSCGLVTFDPRAKPEDPDPVGSHPGAVVVPIEVHGPPDALLIGTVRITSERVDFSWGALVTTSPPCTGQPPTPSHSVGPS